VCRRVFLFVDMVGDPASFAGYTAVMAPALLNDVDGDRGARRFIPLFVGIVLVEVLTIAALYWFGRYFGPA
jgi:hypothetical protein